jgi:hypothetical protein
MLHFSLGYWNMSNRPWFEQQAPYLTIKPFLHFLKHFFQAIEGVEKVVINMGGFS